MSSSKPAAPAVAATIVVVMLGLSVSPPARADEVTDCVGLHRQAQELRRADALIEAQERLLACSEATCPDAIRVDCRRWVAEVDVEMPSVVLIPRDGTGRVLDDVAVERNGRAWKERTNGQAWTLNPGRHILRWRRANGASVTSDVVVLRSQKNRVIDAVFPTEEAPAPVVDRTNASPVGESASDRARALRAPAFVALGLGTVALGSFGIFAIASRNRYAELSDRCAPVCSEDEAQELRRQLIAADVSLVVGLVSMAVGGVLLWRSANVRPTAASAR